VTRISNKLVLFILAFLIVAMTAAIWIFRVRRTSESNVPQFALLDPALKVCQIMQDPDRFSSRQIKVEGNLVGYHEPALYSPACKREDNYIRVDFESASREVLVQGVGDLNGAGLHGGNFWFHVILSGRFEKIAELEGKTPPQLSGDRKHVEYKYRLVASSVQRVTAVSDDAPWW
jgi:hypothetical protein